jgi:hypothetical protein
MWPIEEILMPAQRFTVHVNQDEMTKLDLAAGLSKRAGTDHTSSSSAASAHHGARDGRQAARQRSERDHAGRASSTGTSRSYAFRRS